VEELRCDNKILFGHLAAGVLEVKCRSGRCGAGPGVVVIHRFSTVTGDLINTRRFRDASTWKEKV
jgi:hypothetical protein